MSHSQQPCAACKLQRRKCTQECIFAPHFPPDQPQKFADIHKVFGASNVAKLLSELPTMSREEAVISLSYEARARLDNPVYGCVGTVAELQHKLKQVQMEIEAAKQELLKYMGDHNQHQSSQALMIPNLATVTNNSSPTTFLGQNQHMMMQMMGGGGGGGNQILEAQLLATQLEAVAREQQQQQQHQEMFRVYDQREQHHNQHEVIGFSGGNGIMEDHVADSVVTGNGFNQINGGEVEPCLALGSMDGYNDQPSNHHHQQVNHEQSQVEIPAHHEQLFFQSEHQEPDHHQQSPGSDEARSSGPTLS